MNEASRSIPPIDPSMPPSEPETNHSVPPEAKKFVPPEPNPVTMARHRHEVFVQITIPFILLVTIFLVMVVLAWIANAMQASRWADISIVFLSVLLTVMLVLGIAALVAIAYLVIYLNKSLPPYTRLVQDYTQQAGHYARVFADRAGKILDSLRSLETIEDIRSIIEMI